jgi:hypothetical protein
MTNYFLKPFLDEKSCISNCNQLSMILPPVITSSQIFPYLNYDEITNQLGTTGSRFHELIQPSQHQIRNVKNHISLQNILALTNKILVDLKRLGRFQSYSKSYRNQQSYKDEEIKIKYL